MESKKVITTAVNNRSGSSERGRNIKGGRRVPKKYKTNNDTNASNSKAKSTSNEEANVLRTRSGRTRTATNLNNAASSRKKATITSTAKPSSIEMEEIKAKKAISSEVMKAKVP